MVVGIIMLSCGITSVLSPLQFSGENAERLKKTYGKFCGQHNQSVNYFKDLYTKDKRFQAFVKVLIWIMRIPVVVQGIVSLWALEPPSPHASFLTVGLLPCRRRWAVPSYGGSASQSAYCLWPSGSPNTRFCSKEYCSVPKVRVVVLCCCCCFKGCTCSVWQLPG